MNRATTAPEAFPAEANRWAYLAIPLFVAIAFATLLGSLNAAPDAGLRPDSYMGVYGGERTTYLRILTSDCAGLQTEIAQATESHDGAEMGTVQYQTRRGYMTAALDRFAAADCDDA